MAKFLLPNNPIPHIGMPPGLPNMHMLNSKSSNGVKRAINYAADLGGCGHWRMVWPAYMINIYQKGVVTTDIAMVMDPRYYNEVRSVRLQRQATPQQVQLIKHLKGISQQNGMKLLYEVDDVIFRNDIPIYNACRGAFDTPVIEAASKEAMLLCDHMTVVSEYMADYYRKQTGHPNITHIPNYMPKFWFDRFYNPEKIALRYEKHKKKPRIGAFSSGTHIDARLQNGGVDDFTHVNDQIIKTCRDIQWVIVGTKPHKLAPYIDKGLIEFHPWVNLNDFPSMMDSLDINITFAPLLDNVFNRSKSDIKITEAGALGIPCICQDMTHPYGISPVKFTTGDDLISKVVQLMKDPDYYFDISKKVRAIAETRWLEDHIQEYVDLYRLN